MIKDITGQGVWLPPRGLHIWGCRRMPREHFWNGCKHNYYRRWKKKMFHHLTSNSRGFCKAKQPSCCQRTCAAHPTRPPRLGARCLQRFGAGNMGHTASSRDARIGTNCKHTHLIDVLKTSALAEILLSKHAFQ